MSNNVKTVLSDPEVFEYWSKLAVQDPEQFERERRDVIDEAISAAPVNKQERLRQLQWRIDVERTRASNPLSACIRLNQMMFASLYAENGFMNIFRTAAHPVPKREARILAFQKKK